MNLKFEQVTPESVGCSSQALLNFLQNVQNANHEMHSFILLKDGKIICEKYWQPFAAQYRHQLFSLSKSFTSTAIGMAVDEKLLTTSTLLADIFADEFTQLAERVNDKIRKMTIKNLLTMSTGMEYETWSMAAETDNITAFLSGHFKDNPGETFRYSSIATYMLSAAITRLTGKTLTEYLAPRLFEPLGITDYYWSIDPQTGVELGGFGLNLTTPDIAKFGQFLLQKGNWNGKQLVSADWIEEATSKQISNASGDESADKNNDWAQGYGYQFWRCKPAGVYRGDGMYGQYCVVVPAENIVIAATSNADMGKVLNLFWQLLDDLKTAEKLPNSSAALAEYDNLTHLIAEKSDKYPNYAAGYKIVSPKPTNPENTAYLAFDFRGGECILETYNLRGYENNLDRTVAAFLFQQDKWLKYAAPHITSEQRLRHEKINRVATYGTWDEKNRTFTMTTWFYESATKDQFRAIFSEDYSKMTIEKRGGGFDSQFAEICKAEKTITKINERKTGGQND
ncbi:MAG: beta-lactamase family protein [Defluviitaleaceae bacterium]|nr:beta-lactamase family protein [Defluviitaleaceae bacterium]